MNTLTNYEHIPDVTQALSNVQDPAISDYSVGKLTFELGIYAASQMPRTDYEQLLQTLQAFHLLTPLAHSNAFVLFGRSASDPREILCAIDPFAYISHLSAMEYHGLTDRFSKILYATRPSFSAWKNQAAERMKKDLGDQLSSYRSSGLPLLSRQNLASIGKTSVHFKERTQLGAFRHLSGSTLRVATIGRVFLDMIREPKLCGGIQHVLDVYEKEAQRYVKFIVDEVNVHGTEIDKVRAGYVLSEVCQLQHATIDTWVNFVQRGEYRKLDPDSDYVYEHSEKWMLSINVPALMNGPDKYDVLDQDRST